MNLKLLPLFAGISLFFNLNQSFAQGDNCSSATALGTFTAPICPGGSSAVLMSPASTFSGSNSTATSGIPYVFSGGCSGANNTSNPAIDVWYSVTTGATTTILEASINGLQSPNIALWEGTCANLTGRGCGVGTGGVVNQTFTGLAPNTTYLLQISGGNMADRGSFNLSVRAGQECQPCAGLISLTANPQPVNGMYQPGQVVTFTLTVNGWNKRGGGAGGSNWFKGFELKNIGTAWGPISNIVLPPSCDGIGTWAYDADGFCVGGGTGCPSTQNFANGIYYSSQAPNAPGTPNPDQGTSFGDGASDDYPPYQAVYGGITPCGNGVSTPNIWTFSWQMTVGSCPPYPNGNALSIQVNTLTDVEAQVIGTSQCSDDPIVNFSASLECCAPPTVRTFNACSSLNNGRVRAFAPLASPPFTYIIYDEADIQVGASIVSPDSATFGGLAPGYYIVRYTNNDNCTSAAGVLVGNSAGAFSLSHTQTNISCNGVNDGTISLTTVGGTPPFTYLWSNASTEQNLTGLASGVYNVTVEDALACPQTLSVTITEPSVLGSTATIASPLLCHGDCNGAINASITGGTTPYTFLWSNGQTDASLTGLCAGSYGLTTTDNNGCTAVNNITLSQPNRLVVNGGQNRTVLPGTNITLGLPILATGGTPAYNYIWSEGSTTQDISPTINTPGFYCVTVNDQNGCQSDDCVFIDVACNTAFIANSFIENENCNLQDGVITVQAGTNNADFTFIWSGGTPNTAGNSISGLSSGVYSVTVTHIGTGCSVTDTYTVGVSSNNYISNVVVTAATCGNSDGGATVVTIPLTNPTYLWSGGQTDQIVTGLAPGYYTVRVGDGGACDDLFGFTIPVSALNIQAINPINASCGIANGGIEITVTGNPIPPLTYIWSDGPNHTTAIRNNLSAGNYTVWVADAANCSGSVTFSINDAGLDPASITINSVTDVSCPRANDGSINFVANYTGVNLPTSVEIINGSGVYTNNQLPGGDYSIVLRDANGCVVATEDVVIEEPEPTEIVLDEVSIACFGQANGRAFFTFLPANNTYNILVDGNPTSNPVNNLSVGNHNIVVTNNSGCTVAGDFSILQPSPLVATAQIITSISCNGQNVGEARVNVTGGSPFANGDYSYIWSNNATTSTITGLTAGTYTVTVVDQGGCLDTARVVLLENPPLQLAFSVNHESCFGQSDGSILVNTTGGTGLGTYNYSWTTGQTTEDLIGVTGGSYVLVVTDANNCSATILPFVNPAVQINLSVTGFQDVSCFGGNNGSVSVTASGGATPYAFSWNSGLFVSEDISGLTAGNYTLVMTDDNGCTVSTNQLISEPTQIVATSTVVDSDCNPANGAPSGSITLNVSGGTINAGGNYTIQWTPNAGGQTGGFITNLAGAPAPFGITYGYSVTDNNGCQISNSVPVLSPTPINVTIANVVAQQCFGVSDGQATATATGGTAPYAFLWSSGETDANAIALPSNLNSVVVTDNNGCTATRTVVVPSATQFTATFTTQRETCLGANNGSITVAPQGGVSPYTYVWSNGTTTSGATGQLGNLSPGSYGVDIYQNNSTCPTIPLTNIVIARGDSFVIDSIAITSANCLGGASGSARVIRVLDGPAVRYEWSNGQFGPQVGNLTAGSYSVTATSANGCEDVETFTVGQPGTAVQMPTVFADTVTCFGDADGSVWIDTLGNHGGTGPYQYAIQGEPFGNDSLFTGLTSGHYWVYIQDSLGCQDSSRIFVATPEQFDIRLRPNYAIIGLGDSVQVDVLYNFTPTFPPLTFAWDGEQPQAISCDTCETTFLFPTESSNFYVTVSDANGCNDTLQMRVTVNPNRNVFIPNAFTPNGDNRNDVFFIHGGAGVELIEQFVVANRWGEIVFQSEKFAPNNPSFGWDGTYGGKTTNPDVFVWYATILFADGKALTYKGEVNLLR